MRELMTALQFLTRIPVPASDFQADTLARSIGWFPCVGVLIGALVALGMALGLWLDAWLGAWLGLMVWIWLTGALHLDGLADLADGLGASHGNAERLLAVMKEPHIGVFGTVAVFALLSGKLLLLWLWLTQGMAVSALLLVCAWSRWGILLWVRLPALHDGRGAGLQGNTSAQALAGNGLLLGVFSLWWAPELLLAPLLIFAWHRFLQRRLGGMNGDCLGAGVEVCECALLLLPLLL